MKVFNSAIVRIFLATFAVFSIISTAGCGKNSDGSYTKSENSTSKVENFAVEFFNKYNLPYQRLNSTDVENTADEYLFYIDDAVIYRTLNDYVVAIVERSNIRETEEQLSKDYSGELYNVFENDSVDVLKYSACGDFAIMCSLSTIPNWEDSEVIADFMEFAANY